ncbi:MAG: hypothetical protein CMC05_04135 [Flavobacteriaceae bacterium]|nr:hypothetical protein [Flavobacteriaceae bacterium]
MQFVIFPQRAIHKHASKYLKQKMKKISALIFGLISIISFSQEKSEEVILDSIVKEADLLYKYEKVAWNSTDLLMSKRKLKKNYGGYVIYHSNDTIHASFIDKSQEKRIARYSFTASDLEVPYNSNFELIELSESEKELLDIKIKIVNNLSDEKYEVEFPQGFNPNLVLLKDENEYRLYIIMGTPKSNIIPFGNDYLFKTDLNGEIKEWKKFHSRVIPAQTEMPNGGKVISAVHSHLKTTPYITATDICTFRLYGELYGMKEFMVLSTALGKYFKYNIGENKITITEP